MIPVTTFERNPAHRALCGLALNIIGRLQWRHHGIGVLQGYITENTEPELRLHIWSPRLLKQGMDLSGDAHDHRFDMVSHVLCGTVEHDELMPTEDTDGDHAMLALTHARAAADTNYHGPTSPLPGRFKVARHPFKFTAGTSYSFRAGSFHRSPLRGLREKVAVTCIEKREQQDVSARILYPIAHQPVMAFGHDMDQALVDDVVAVAIRSLQAWL